jgi:hypothetical protein
MWIYVIRTDREQIAYIIRVRGALRSAQKEGTRRSGHTCGWSSPVSPAKLCRRSSPSRTEAQARERGREKRKRTWGANGREYGTDPFSTFVLDATKRRGRRPNNISSWNPGTGWDGN